MCLCYVFEIKGLYGVTVSVLTNHDVAVFLRDASDLLEKQADFGDRESSVLPEGCLWTDAIVFCPEDCLAIDVSNCSVNEPYNYEVMDVLTCPGYYPGGVDLICGDVIDAISESYGKKLMYMQRFEVARIIASHLNAIVSSLLFHKQNKT